MWFANFAWKEDRHDECLSLGVHDCKKNTVTAGLALLDDWTVRAKQNTQPSNLTQWSWCFGPVLSSTPPHRTLRESSFGLLSEVVDSTG